MQKFWSILVFGVSIGYFGVVEAAYVIKLRSGKEFITGRYWYEGTQVMFDLNGGGVLGIDRSSVTAIEESNKPVNPIPTVESSGEAKPQGAAREERENKNESSPASPKSEIKRDEDPIL